MLTDLTKTKSKITKQRLVHTLAQIKVRFIKSFFISNQFLKSVKVQLDKLTIKLLIKLRDWYFWLLRTMSKIYFN